MKSLKRRVAWDVCDIQLNDKVTYHSFKSEERSNRFQKVHPLKSDQSNDVSIDVAFGSHRCPSHLFLASSTVKELHSFYARVFPDRVQFPNNIDLSEATGAYRCPVHLFVASQYKDEYNKRHENLTLEESQEKRRRNPDTFRSDLTIYPEGGPSVQIPADNNVKVKKRSIVGRIARRCLKSLRRVSRK